VQKLRAECQRYRTGFLHVKSLLSLWRKRLCRNP